MNQQQLAGVIDRWRGFEDDDYGMGKKLQDLWEEAHPVSPAYDDPGILSLVELLTKEFLCQKAQELHRGYFVEGGGLQTFGQLYDYLEEC